jgi:alternate signal-mediated exported protein
MSDALLAPDRYRTDWPSVAKGKISMNKLSKGLIAGGIGLLLLGGGAGTLALWNDSATVDAGPVGSGVMRITASDGVWSDDISLWVPGDSSTYGTELTINLAGDNLSSELALDAGSITGDPELLEALDIGLTVGTITGGGTATPVPGEDNTFTLVSGTPATATTLTVPVTIDVDFPADSVTDLVAQNQTVDLGTMAFTLTQLAP